MTSNENDGINWVLINGKWVKTTNEFLVDQRRLFEEKQARIKFESQNFIMRYFTDPWYGHDRREMLWLLSILLGFPFLILILSL